MGTSRITRNKVDYYTVKKNKGDESKFTKLREARIYARDLLKLGNFKQLKNSNGVILPL